MIFTDIQQSALPVLVRACEKIRHEVGISTRQMGMMKGLLEHVGNQGMVKQLFASIRCLEWSFPLIVLLNFSDLMEANMDLGMRARFLDACSPVEPISSSSVIYFSLNETC
jgi:hypothetical protein